MMQLAKGRVRSPALMTSGTAFLTGSEGQGGDGGSLSLATFWQIRGGARSPKLTFSGWFTHTLSTGSAVLSRRGAGTRVEGIFPLPHRMADEGGMDSYPKFTGGSAPSSATGMEGGWARGTVRLHL